eukprot:TRINITY_DN1095_c0_g1_i1.p1 TRINITY_DN1095_c0_g1~~TRINITY_DN1095_c0_g1_i1.p1  ORF type:complete len:384 (+),score=52.27 TRINITY_DN1095_c0_g1_i1:389-1540(+)
MEQKRKLGRGACMAVVGEIRLDGRRCTNSPFTETAYLTRRGYLPLPPEPAPEILQTCRGKRYLLWTRNLQDFGAGHSHKWFSLSCALWEAYSLNRTLVLDTFVGMNKRHSGTLNYHVDVPFEAWYSTESLKKLPAGGMLYHDFLQDCGKPGILRQANGDVAIVPSGVSHAEMVALSKVPLLIREFDKNLGLEPQSMYGYQICHRSDTPDSMGFVNELGVDYNLPKEYRALWYAPWVYDMVTQIMATAGLYSSTPKRMAVCLHVRRGDKVTDPTLQPRYPNLDHETSPAGILETIQQHVPHGSTLYIATNEPDPVTYFKPLEEHYVLQSLAHLTDVLDSSQFLRSTLGVVDYTILDRCPMMIPTFRTEKSRGFDTALSLSASAK